MNSRKFYGLVCHETRQKLCLGNGWNGIFSQYYIDNDKNNIRKRLMRFLESHKNAVINFVVLSE